MAPSIGDRVPHTSLLEPRGPLTTETALRVRITRGITWAWRFELAVLALCAMYSATRAGSWEAWVAYAVPLALVSAAAATCAGIVAGLTAPALDGYARACVLGALVVVPIIAAAVIRNDGSVRPLSGTLALAFLLGGAAFGASSRAQRGPTGWPVGTDWP